jgi:DNA-3-methyladenine glycosylase
MDEALNPAFFDRDTKQVARDLLGCVIHRGEVGVRILETEAYFPGDSANHAYRGKTTRNAPMWGPPGHLYVYLCYGIHTLVNLVTEAEGRPAAVLIRAAEVVTGHDTVRSRRGGRLDLIGPGKVGQALGLDLGWSGRPLGQGLRVVRGTAPPEVRTAPRVGIDAADPADVAACWRYIAAG